MRVSTRFINQSSMSEFWAFMAGKAAGAASSYMLEARMAEPGLRSALVEVARSQHRQALNYRRAYYQAKSMEVNS